MLSKVLSTLLTVYSAKWWRGERGGWGRNGGREGAVSRGRGSGRGRDSLLMSIWWVFSRCRDLFVLLLFPESSIPPSPPRERTLAQRIRRCCGVRLFTASCQRQLIGSSRIDPRILSPSQLWPNPSEWPLWHVLKCRASVLHYKNDLLKLWEPVSEPASVTLDEDVPAAKCPQKM